MPLNNSSESTKLSSTMTQDQLLDLVTGFHGTKTGLVTPEVAGWLLMLNTHNRPLNTTTIKRFSAILTEGRWQNTGEPVIVSHEGILNDGQHRLTAIRNTGLAAAMDIRFGIARAAFNVTGTGTKRTAAHVVSVAGYSHSTTRTSIARLLYYYDTGNMAMHSQRLDSDLMLQIIEREPLIGDIAAKIQRFTFPPARAAPFAMILVVAARHAPVDRVFAFADIAAGGLCQDEEEAPRRLHVRFRDASASRERKLGPLDTAILTVHAWNAWAQGRTLSRLMIQDSDRESGGFPQVMPIPSPTVASA